MENTREQANRAQQSETTNQQKSRAGAANERANDRERPIESGRESDTPNRSGMGVVRQSNRAPVRGIGNSPFMVMRRMAEDMDRLFEQFGFGRTGLTTRFGTLLDDDLWSDRGLLTETTAWSPQVEMSRRGDNLVIRADLPGIKKDDVKVEIENDLLTISGERRDEREEEHEGFYRSERSYGQFYRAIPLPEGVNSEQCDATFKDGVLEVRMPAPKQPQESKKRIQVK